MNIDPCGNTHEPLLARFSACSAGENCAALGTDHGFTRMSNREAKTVVCPFAVTAVSLAG
ncbi:MAG: hypothetical protein H0U72_02145 [Nitrosospira sp.]|nr:hypothetical protein [Nitrosospira sp.]